LQPVSGLSDDHAKTLPRCTSFSPSQPENIAASQFPINRGYGNKAHVRQTGVIPMKNEEIASASHLTGNLIIGSVKIFTNLKFFTNLKYVPDKM